MKEFDEVHLERIKHAVGLLLSPVELSTARFELSDERIRHGVYKAVFEWQSVGKHRVYRHPKTWWDAFKLRFRRWIPWHVKINYIEISAYMIFPDIKLPDRREAYFDLGWK